MSFARKGMLVSLSQMGVIVLGGLSSIVLYRAMGPKGTGQFNLFRQTATFAVALTAFGIGTASVYYLRNRKTPIKQVVGTLCGYAILMSLPLAAVMTAAVLLFPAYFGNVPFWVSAVFAVGTASLMALALLRMVLVAQMAARRIATTNLTPTVVLLVVGGALALAHRLTAAVAIGLYAASGLLALAQVLGYLRPHLRLWGSFSWPLFRNLFAYGSKLYIANILNLLGGTGTLMLLRHYTLSDFGQVGLFSAAAGISSYINLPITAMSPLLYAKWSEVSGPERVLQVERVARVNMAFGVLGSIGAILAGRLAIWVMFGRQFMPAQAALNLMAPAVALISFYGIFDSLLAGAGRAGVSAYIFGIECSLSLGLTALLVPHMGFVGAAVATLAGNAAAAVAGLLICSKLIGIRPLNCLVVRASDLRYLAIALWKRKSVGTPPSAESIAPAVAAEGTHGTSAR